MHPGGAGPQQTPFKRLNGQIRPLLEEVGDANPCDGVVPRKIGKIYFYLNLKYLKLKVTKNLWNHFPMLENNTRIWLRRILSS